MRHCEKLLRENKLLSSKSPPTLENWTDERHWWVWGECLYCTGRLRRSDPARPAISQRYADDALRILKQKILPYFGQKTLDKISVEALEQWLFSAIDQGFSRKTVNSWASVFKVMLREAVRIGLLDNSPFDKVPLLMVSSKRRGILRTEEVQRLLNPRTVEQVWKGPRLYYAANLTAAFTGLRQGEVLGLRREDMFPDHIHVEHSWGIKYGLGPTKTKAVADLPIPRGVRLEIEKHLTHEGFVFSFSDGARPTTGNRLTESLYAALERIGISEQERKERNLTFHSWRHFFNTYLRSRGVPDAKVQAVTRHKTQAMTEHYTRFQLEDFHEVHEAQTKLAESLEESQDTT